MNENYELKFNTKEGNISWQTPCVVTLKMFVHLQHKKISSFFKNFILIKVFETFNCSFYISYPFSLAVSTFFSFVYDYDPRFESIDFRKEICQNLFLMKFPCNRLKLSVFRFCISCFFKRVPKSCIKFLSNRLIVWKNNFGISLLALQLYQLL